ncbi:hypothetical protein PV326_005459 [Microctonus aethiopoides]|nr:hypothetical protein PV326_005459 [Microctonus aethiopoides]
MELTKKLCEEWALANSRECVDNGNGKIGNGSGSSLSNDDHEKASEATFTLKYLGSTLVETPSSEEATAEAIKTVITMVQTVEYIYIREGTSFPRPEGGRGSGDKTHPSTFTPVGIHGARK